MQDCPCQAFWRTISSGYLLLHNIVPWISWLSNKISSCIWETMFLEAYCDQQLTSLKNLSCVPSHKTLDFIIHCLEVFIRVFIAIKIPIMDHIDLTCNIINITILEAHRKNCCRIVLQKAWHGQSCIPDCALHLRWSIRILAQRSWYHKMVSYEVLVAHSYDFLLNLIQ